MQPSSWICAQLGAREHYAVPRALLGHNSLEHLFTDYWHRNVVRTFTRRLNHRITNIAASRYHPDLPDSLVSSWNFKSILQNFSIKRSSLASSSAQRYETYCRIGESFGRQVTKALSSHNVSENQVFFGYDTASLEIMHYMKQANAVCYLDQIDPCRTEVNMIQEEAKQWQGWQDFTLDVPDVFYERHAAEWEIADRVIVNSEFSQQALIEQGVPPEKISIVPLAFDPRSTSLSFTERLRSTPYSKSHPLRVLFLGQVTLRKGIQYLMEAANRLKDEAVIFNVVGSHGISSDIIVKAPSNMNFHGSVAPAYTSSCYQQNDLFVLPTLSDGFAITQLEAMAEGLPVIATNHCGKVVTDYEDGRIIPIRDSNAIANSVQYYLSDINLLNQHASKAMVKSQQFSLDALYQNLRNLHQLNVKASDK